MPCTRRSGLYQRQGKRERERERERENHETSSAAFLAFGEGVKVGITGLRQCEPCHDHCSNYNICRGFLSSTLFLAR